MDPVDKLLPERIKARPYVPILLIIIMAAPILYLGLKATPFKNPEARWALATLSYSESDTGLIPRFDGDPWLKKPIPFHWLLYFNSRLWNRIDQETQRLPSVMSAVLLLLFTHLLARKWFGPATGMIAPLVLMTTQSFIVWGRTAQPDMSNALAILIVIWLLLGGDAVISPVRIYAAAVIAALGSHIKGLFPYAVSGLVLLTTSLFRRDWHWFRLKNLIIPGLVSLVFYFIPFLIIALVDVSWEPLQAVWRENVVRLLLPFDHIQSPYYYFYKILTLTLPWSIFLPFLVFYLLRSERARTPEFRLLLVIIATIFIFFQLSGSRRSYYLLPILPFTSMAFSEVLLSINELSLTGRRISQILKCVIGITLQIPLIFQFPFLDAVFGNIVERILGGGWPKVFLDLYHSSTFLASCLFLSSIGIYVIISSWKNKKGTLSVVLGVYSIFVVFFGIVNPAVQSEAGIQRFASEVQPVVIESSLIGFTDSKIHSATLLFYLRPDKTLFFDQPEDALKKLTTSDALLFHKGDLLPEDKWFLLAEEKKWDIRLSRQRPRWRIYRPVQQ